MLPHFTHAIVLDFEATCDDGAKVEPQEVIEFPSVLLSLATQDTVDEFQTFVRPHHHPTLTEFCTRFTSISQADVDAAPTFPEVLAAHQTWFESHGLSEENALIVTCGDWDLGTMLPAQCLVSQPPIEVLHPIYRRWQNIKRTFCQVRGVKRSGGMASMLRAAGVPLVGHHHRGIDDCRNIASLLRSLLAEGGVVEVTRELPGSGFPPTSPGLRQGDE